MAWMTVGQIESSFNVSGLFAVETMNTEFASRMAATDIRKWIDPADYTFILLSALPDGYTADDFVKWNALRDGHALLTISKLLLTNTQIRRDGVVKQERGESGQTTNQFLSPAEVKQLRDQYEAEAKAIIAPYIPAVMGAGSIGTIQIGSGSYC